MRLDFLQCIWLISLMIGWTYIELSEFLFCNKDNILEALRKNMETFKKKLFCEENRPQIINVRFLIIAIEGINIVIIIVLND